MGGREAMPDIVVGVSSVYAAVEPCLVQSCAPSGGCADGERRVCTEFVGAGNSVLPGICSRFG
jgi:hypothetical protein